MSMNREKADKILTDLNVPTLPSEITAKLHEMDEHTLAGLSMAMFTQQVASLIELASRLQGRCGVCRAQETGECAHCVADSEVVKNIVKETAILARITQAATAPGSRIAAQMEARREAQAAEKAASAS